MKNMFNELNLSCDDDPDDAVLMQPFIEAKKLRILLKEGDSEGCVNITRPKVLRLVKWLIKAFSITAEELGS